MCRRNISHFFKQQTFFMAKQDGIIPLKGTIDKITFYKSGDGYLARKKTGLDANRIATDPAFERTRETGAEFTRAGEATKLLSDSLRSYLLLASDSKLPSRLTKAMMAVIKADATNIRGKRNVIDGEAVLLKGFDFNINGRLKSTVTQQYVTALTRVTGQLKVDFPIFIPVKKIKAPDSATHFTISAIGVEANFEAKTYVLDEKDTGVLPWTGDPTAAISLAPTVTPNSTHLLFLILGITFFMSENGAYYPLKDMAYNSLAIVDVNGQ